MDRFVLILIRLFFKSLNCLPLPWRIKTTEALIKTAIRFSPRHSKVALANIRLAFPKESPEWHQNLYNNSFSSLARLIVDFGRLPEINKEWIEQNVDISYWPSFLELKRRNNGKGVLLVTGHLGSFELQAYILSVLGHPIKFVVRNFKLPAVDKWWNAQRERLGNKAIPRRGAFRQILASLRNGDDVALLFDQNVTRNFAVFIEWFGRPAATTKAVALAALRCQSPVVISALLYKNSRYSLEAREIDLTGIYSNTTLSDQEKIMKITSILVKEYEDLIRLSPESWFWMHRRWKTTQSQDDEKQLYQASLAQIAENQKG